jgi:spermidine synthase
VTDPRGSSYTEGVGNEAIETWRPHPNGFEISSMMTTTIPLRAALVLIGFTAVIAQIVLMRELIVVFCGNEISLGLILTSWLFWTAVGSSLAGTLVVRWEKTQWLVAALQMLISAVFPATIWAVRYARNLFHPLPGEILGPGPMILTSLAVLSLFCATSGCLFAAGSRLYAEVHRTSTAKSTGAVYLLEALGSGIGGILASLVLIRYFPAFGIAMLLGLLNLVVAVYLTARAGWYRRTATLVLIGVYSLFVATGGVWRLEDLSLARLWRGYHLSTTSNSVYGNLAVVETEGGRSLFQNGLDLLDVPNLAAAEEAVHFALLQHPAPRSLLLVGGGVNGSLAQALEHRSLQEVDYVELDPAILDLAARHFGEEWARIQVEPRVRIEHSDGRLFLKTTAARYDVIIVDLPDPQTAQLNRFYTLEFFREVAGKLNAHGIFSFQVRGAENYISPELADFLRCLNRTLREVFPEVTFIPGDRVHFFAAARAGLLASDYRPLLARLGSRHLQTTYVREYYLPFRMTPDRMADLELQIRPRPDTPVNRDFAPIAYYFDVVLWSAQFSQIYRRLFQYLAGVKFVTLLGWIGLVLSVLSGGLLSLRRKDPAGRSGAAFCATAMGFTLISLEILLLLGFQAIYGYVYYQLAVLIAGFMAGMALGSWWGLRAESAPESPRLERREMLIVAALQGMAALSPLLLYSALDLLARIHSQIGLRVVTMVVFPTLAVLAGALGGYQFPVASRIFFRSSARRSGSPGSLYGFDLLGSCLGALVLSAYLVPVFGFLRTALLIGVINLAPAVLAAITALDLEARRT